MPGTGLNLSLVYQFIKSEKEEIKVDTHEGEGGELIIMLAMHKQSK